MKSSVCLCTDLLFPDRLVGEHTATASGARKKNYAKKKKVLWFTTGKQCLSWAETTIQILSPMALFHSGPTPQVAWPGAWAYAKKKVLWFTTGKQCLSRVETTIQLKDCLALVWATMALFRSGPRPQVAAAGAQVAWPGAWACGD